jgi:formate dehydrogenase iron-sulfur subunit
MTMQSSLDIVARSATTTPSASVRQGVEVAKLIDESKCIGCKACQVACSQWNELSDDIGTNVGVYDNPSDLTDKSWTLMRFAEVETSGSLEWLIRKDGCMHCADPGCLKACPSPGAIVQYANGIVDFKQENCIGCGNCVTGCPFDIPRISEKGQEGLQVHAVLRPGFGRAGACLRQDLPDRRHHLRQEGRHGDLRQQARWRTQGARLQGSRSVQPVRGGRHARHVCAEAR